MTDAAFSLASARLDIFLEWRRWQSDRFDAKPHSEKDVFYTAEQKKTPSEAAAAAANAAAQLIQSSPDSLRQQYQKNTGWDFLILSAAFIASIIISLFQVFFFFLSKWEY